ncbi:MAG: hypothetical protein ACR2Q4_19400 [Geminicoccaceae bacterium]
MPLDVRATGEKRTLGNYWNFRQNLGRKQIFSKLDSALSMFRFGAIEDYLDQHLMTESGSPLEASPEAMVSRTDQGDRERPQPSA